LNVSLATAPVQDQADVAHPAVTRQCAHELVRVRHLRHAFRVHEARDFDALDAAADGALDEFALHRERQDFGLVLQPVARADLDDLDPASGDSHALIVYTLSQWSWLGTLG
jgi:hypothetical protein